MSDVSCGRDRNSHPLQVLFRRLRRTAMSRSGPRTTTTTSPGPSVAPNSTTLVPMKPVEMPMRWLVTRLIDQTTPPSGTPVGTPSAEATALR